MASMAVAKIGKTPPFLAPSGAKTNGAAYVAHLENNVLPSVAAVSAANGKESAFSFMQDGATSRGRFPILKAVKKNAGEPFGLKWPARSPGLNPCDYFSRGAMESFLGGMEKAPQNEA